MAKIQCKMCGGMNDLRDGVTSWECPYCGSLTTFPKPCDEQLEKLFARAEHFRQKNDFDKAISIYESILDRNAEDPEACWGLLISRYGIEYVEDPATHERIPTCHRVQFDSILSDPDYLNVLKYASGSDRDIYEKEAHRIAEIQKDILRISAQEKPYDVFICYKEATDGGSRTKDSTLAQDIYYQLTKQGMKVFFSRITLENKLGQQYEPYIFAALNSAKVMLVIGSKKEYFEAVWVKNEWSRFLALMKKDRSRLLIPCYRDMDVYDIPEELSMFQCQDMSKIGFIQDLLHGISKVVNAEKQNQASAASEPVAVPGFDNDKIMRRISILMEQTDWDEAKSYCKKLLENDPENPELYFMLCLIDNRIPGEEALLKSPQDLSDDKNFRTALKLASPERKHQLEAILQESSCRLYLERCLSKNHISSEDELPQCKSLLSEDQDFQMALKLASPERKGRLEIIQQENIVNFYLTACMEKNRISGESRLSRCETPLSEDQDFQMAVKFASPERKKALLKIQYDQGEFFFNKLKSDYPDCDLISVPVPLVGDERFLMALKLVSPEQREQLQDISMRQSDYFLGKCMEANHVFTPSELVRCEMPLAEDDNFFLALISALPEQQEKLQALKQDQSDYYLRRCLEKYHVSDVSELINSQMDLGMDRDFQMAIDCALPDRAKELEEMAMKQFASVQEGEINRYGIIATGVAVVIFLIIVFVLAYSKWSLM